MTMLDFTVLVVLVMVLVFGSLWVVLLAANDPRRHR
jgi:hypothetical protein